MLIHMVGRRPPPIGGVTVHTDRLARWLSNIPGVDVNCVDVGAMSLLRLAFGCLAGRGGAVIVHCQISSVWGFACIALLRQALMRKAMLVYSIHSEYWVRDNLAKAGLRARVAKYCLGKVALLIADNPRIARDVQPHVGVVEVITPFLPPMGALEVADLPAYLGLAPFDAPALVFNAYKLVYRNDGSDVYGLDVLLKMYFSLQVPLTMVLLIPQLLPEEAERIRGMVERSGAALNRGRLHVVSRLDIEGWKAIAMADLFVRPTITDGDALSVREALYFDVPTIVSDCTVRPEGTVLFRTGDAEDLAQKILAVLAAGPQRRRAAPSHCAAGNPAAVFHAAYARTLQRVVHD